MNDGLPKPPPRSNSRRAFLRGAGAMVTLPWLESLAHAATRMRLLGAQDDGAIAASQGLPPNRLVVLYMANGAWPPAWNPVDDGPSFTLSPTLTPLAPVRDDVLVLTGLANRNSVDGDGHYAKTAPFLTGKPIRRTGGRDLQNGISIDQLAAQAQGGATPLASLELGCEPVRPVEDMGYSTVYGGHISWSDPATPCTKEIVPARVFDRLFRSAAWRRGAREKSVLDAVREDARRLDARVATGDRAKLAEYFDAVRDLERRIERCSSADVGADRAALPAAGILAPPPGMPADHPTHVALMLDLIALALRTDATRVVSFMFGNAVSGIDMSFLPGVHGGHHELSHHEDRPEKTAQYQAINRWHVEQFVAFIQRLAAIDDGGARLLDRSLVLFGSALKDGNRHESHDLPLLLAGRGAGNGCVPLATGAHLRAKEGTPLCNLHLSLLQRMGGAARDFSDSTGPLLPSR
ncbi:MAG: DUF1552 domain-containing protein [Planctomycetes bacterium]|nr:DUF1552 domain-containing protein [Planctomycetota bacterium]